VRDDAVRDRWTKVGLHALADSISDGHRYTRDAVIRSLRRTT
jgi:hypothetical protein